ncbi:hypothetical protein Vafri_190 [Volvox africanus]|nr:hypothetical protein Vafri_190 [Volvox africanus]
MEHQWGQQPAPHAAEDCAARSQAAGVGGRMVYSTCTFNPVEDEAVVAELLLRCGGALELVDVSECMPQLRRMAGKHQWKVKDKHRFYGSWDEARDIGYKLEESMFPSPAKAALPLERCMRFLPHHGDTGGFFVAVLRKVSELPAEVFRQVRRGAAEALAAAPGSATATAATPGATGTGRDANGFAESVAEDDGEEDVEEDEAAAAVAACAAAGVADAEDGDRGDVGDADGKDEEAEPEANAADGGGEVGEDVDAMEGVVERTAAPGAANPQAGATAAAEEPGSWDSGPKPTPLETARAAAEAAIAAAESALAAYEAGDLDSALRASSNADASARRAAAVAQRDKAGFRARQSQDKPRGQQQQQPQQRHRVGEEAQAAEKEVAADGEQAGPVQTSWIRGGGGRGRPDGGKYSYIDPVAPLEDDSVLSILYDYYGIPPDFPLRSQLVMRALDRHPKRLYFVARSVLDLMMQDSREVIKIVSTGLKVFERQLVRDQINECPYRLSQEGLPLVLPYITRQRIEVPPQVLVQLLRDRNLILPAAAAAAVVGETTPSGNPRGNKPTLTDESVLSALAPLKLGCLVCELSANDAHRLGFAASVRASPEEAKALLASSSVTAPKAVPTATANGGDAEEVTGGLAVNAPFAVVAWKGPASLAIMVEKAECAQMLDKLESELKKLSTC